MSDIQKSLAGQSLLYRRERLRAILTPDRFWLTGKALMYTGTGAGVESNTSGLAAYALPNAVTSTARGMIPLPSNWAGKLTQMQIVWMPADANAGNVAFTAASLRRLSNDGTITTLEDITTGVDAAPLSATKTAIYQINFSALPTDITAGEFLSIAIARGGADAADTYANTVYLIGLGLGIR